MMAVGSWKAMQQSFTSAALFPRSPRSGFRIWLIAHSHVLRFEPALHRLVRSDDAGAGGVVYVPSPRRQDADT